MEDVEEAPMSLNDIQDQERPRPRSTLNDIQDQERPRPRATLNDIQDQEMESSNAEEEFFMEDQEVVPANVDAFVNSNGNGYSSSFDNCNSNRFSNWILVTRAVQRGRFRH